MSKVPAGRPPGVTVKKYDRSQIDDPNLASQETSLPSDLARDSDGRKQGSWLPVTSPVGKSEVNTTRSFLDRAGDAAFLVLFGAPLAQRDGHLEAVERGAVDLARLAKFLVGIVPPTAGEVVNMAGATLRASQIVSQKRFLFNEGDEGGSEFTSPLILSRTPLAQPSLFWPVGVIRIT